MTTDYERTRRLVVWDTAVKKAIAVVIEAERAVVEAAEVWAASGDFVTDIAAAVGALKSAREALARAERKETT